MVKLAHAKLLPTNSRAGAKDLVLLKWRMMKPQKKQLKNLTVLKLADAQS
jgi:hypothetical protein